ncbi:MAG: molybdopterin-synthase adenylyltransferase MoeB [Flavobacteriales bacterium]
MKRYNRHIILSEIGLEGQNKINKAKVLVIGAGGLGCPVLQYLAAAGVGTLGIVDADNVDVTNLQRQILFGTKSLGQNKAEAAKERLFDINPTINFEVYPFYLEVSNALDIIKNYDIVVDGTDNFTTRYLVNDACVSLDKPLVSASIFKFEGQLSVFNYKSGPSYRCLFPNPPEPGSMPSCSDIGVLGVLPGILGTLQANEVLKIILELGDVLSGKLLIFNALNLNNHQIQFAKNEIEFAKGKLSKTEFENMDYHYFCGLEKPEHIEEVDGLDQFNDENSCIVDVREFDERPKLYHLNLMHIPLSIFDEKCHHLEKQDRIVLVCKSGVRSKKAASKLIKKGYKHIFSLKDGVDGLG